MSRVPLAFYGAAVLYALAGMALGIVMAESKDHILAPLHAHINLLGWATLALMGTFYAHAGQLAPRPLAWACFVSLNLGNLISFPLLARVLQAEPTVMWPIAVGQALIVLSMILFGISVAIVALRSARTPAS